MEARTEYQLFTIGTQFFANSFEFAFSHTYANPCWEATVSQTRGNSTFAHTNAKKVDSEKVANNMISRWAVLQEKAVLQDGIVRSTKLQPLFSIHLQKVKDT